jgi:hypothetical protein
MHTEKNDLNKILLSLNFDYFEILYISDNEYWMHGKCRDLRGYHKMIFNYNQLILHTDIKNPDDRYSWRITERNIFGADFEFENFDEKGRTSKKINKQGLFIYTYNEKPFRTIRQTFNIYYKEYKLALYAILLKYKQLKKWIPHYLEMLKLTKK